MLEHPKAFAVATILMLTVVLTSCGGQGNVGEDVRIEQITMPDGRVVDCIVFQDINEGGVTCDWANAREGFQ
jgi:hypothetical protein